MTEYEDVTYVSSKVDLRYCPFCGEKTERREVMITTWRGNTEVHCPEHGELILK